MAGIAGGGATLAGDDTQAERRLGQALVDERDDAVAPVGTARGLCHGRTIAGSADGGLTSRPR